MEFAACAPCFGLRFLQHFPRYRKPIRPGPHEVISDHAAVPQTVAGALPCLQWSELSRARAVSTVCNPAWQDGRVCHPAMHQLLFASAITMVNCNGQVMALLANGADPSLKSTNGAVAAEWAQQAGFQEVADVLQEHLESEQAASRVAAEAAALSDYQVETDPSIVIDSPSTGTVKEHIIMIIGTVCSPGWYLSPALTVGYLLRLLLRLLP